MQSGSNNAHLGLGAGGVVDADSHVNFGLILVPEAIRELGHGAGVDDVIETAKGAWLLGDLHRDDGFMALTDQCPAIGTAVRNGMRGWMEGLSAMKRSVSNLMLASEVMAA